MTNFISKIKDWLVSENRGLHFSIAYIFFDIINKWNFWVACILTLVFIFLMEWFDKNKLKTKFSLLDIKYGVLGMLIAYLKFKYLG